jgi:PrtD family type I secretion system ABC transporter
MTAILPPLGWVAAFSCLTNLIYLAAPIYMMQVYDRVLHSRGVPTLILLTLAVALCYAAYAVLDAVRGRILAGISDIVEQRLSAAVLGHLTAVRRGGPSTASVHVARDLDTVRQFIAGTGPLAFIDLPWAPIYLGALALLHPTMAWFAVGAAAVLLVLTLASERAARGPMLRAGRVAARSYQFGEAVTRHLDCARTMGLGRGLTDRWRQLRGEMLAAQNAASHRSVVLGAMGKGLRLFFQSAILGVGAWLAIQDAISGGAIFAGSLLLGRMLAPVEAMIGAWRPTLAARDSFQRIRTLMTERERGLATVELPAPAGEVHLEGVSWTPPGMNKPVVRGVAVHIQAGAVLTIVGPSAAGKSTIARLMVGAIRPDIGVARLDGADLATWDPVQLGGAIGYLPQDVALFPGTIRDNIARFGDATDEAVIAAATAARAHDMIVRLPDGYGTVLDETAASLSGGQKQRIALARALLGDPAVVVMDEPNANLDSDGEAALTDCVLALKQRKRTVVMVTHRAGLVRISDYVATMRDGAMTGVQRAAEFMTQQAPAVVAGGRA